MNAPVLHTQAIKSALRITLTYMVAAALWIFTSDYLLERIVTDPFWNTVLHTTKGGLFVIVSGAFLYVLFTAEFNTREKAKQLALASEARLANILEIAANAMIATDGDHRVQLFNPAAEIIFGYQANEMMHKPFDMLLDPASHAAYYEYASTVATASTAQRSGAYFEAQARRRYGSTFPAEVSVAASTHEGQTTYTIIVRDITAQKQAEEDLIASRDRINNILESITDAFFTLDQEWRFTYVNREAERALSHSREELLDQRVWDMFPPAVQTAFFTNYHRVLNEHVSVVFEEYYPPMETWFEVHAYPSPTKDGMSAYFRNINERKRAEQELRRVNRALKTLSACNQTLVRATSERELLSNICHVIVETGGYCLAWVGYAEPDGDRRIIPVAESGAKDNYLDNIFITWADVPQGQGPTGTAVRTGQTRVVKNIHTDDTYALWRENAAKQGFTSSIALPLLLNGTADGTPQRAALNIYSQEPDAFDDAEIALLSELADDIVYGIETLRIRERHRQAEEEVRFQKTLLEAQSEASIDGILIVSPNDEWLFFNQRFIDMWHISDEVATAGVGKVARHSVLNQLVDPDAFLKMADYLYSHPEAIAQDDMALNDGRTFERYSAPVKGTDGTHYGRIWLYRDMTERRRLFDEIHQNHERLQTLSRRLVEIQETERRHIARELHDEIGQALTGLHLVLEMVARIPASDEISRRLVEAHEMVGDLMARVRELSLNLRPAMLDDLGILPTLRWYFQRYTSQTNVRVAFKHSGMDRRFAPEIETVVYRVIQEALTNVARYAGVDDVTVRLWSDQHSLGVQIEDEGAGFDTEAALAKNTSSGLAGMHERVLLLNGEFSIESSPGSGTCVIVEMPLTFAVASNDLL